MLLSVILIRSHPRQINTLESDINTVCVCMCTRAGGMSTTVVLLVSYILSAQIFCLSKIFQQDISEYLATGESVALCSKKGKKKQETINHFKLEATSLWPLSKGLELC